MAEVGLLPFARIALQVSKAVLPCYRSRFSQHQFTQPQLLSILCLLRYEDRWPPCHRSRGAANRPALPHERARDRVDVKKDGSVNADISKACISIEDGAE